MDNQDLYMTNLYSIILEYVKHQGYSSFDISLSKGTEARNYMSIVKRAQIKGVKNGAEVTEDVFIKIPSGSEARNKRQNIRDKFAREAFAYNTVITQLEIVQKNLDTTEKFPFMKCYFATDNVIVLEDLIKSDYRDISDHRETLDLDHMTLLLAELARFHALSFALKVHNPDVFNVLTRDMDNIYTSLHRTHIIVENAWQRALAAISGTNLKDIILKNGQSEKEKSNIPFPKSEYAIICHGDFNLRNALFKYNKSDKPVSAMIIDYQMMNYGSPAMDILFVIFSSTSAELRAVHYEHLLDVYYNSLRNYLEALDCDVHSCYPREIFLSDMHKYFPYGLVAVLIVLRVLCRPFVCDEELNDIYKGDRSVFDYNCAASEEIYAERIEGVFRDLVRLGFINNV